MRATDGTGYRGYDIPRHVWVRVDDHAVPGLFAEWRRTPAGGWEGLCWWADSDGARSGWVPAADLRAVPPAAS